MNQTNEPENISASKWRKTKSRPSLLSSLAQSDTEYLSYKTKEKQKDKLYSILIGITIFR